MIYHRSQLTSSNGHVTGIDSPVPDYPAVARPGRHEELIVSLVEGGLEVLQEYEERTKNMNITCLIDADAIIIRHSIAKEARKRLADN